MYIKRQELFCCYCMENEIQTEGTYFHTSAIFKRNGWGKSFTFSIFLLIILRVALRSSTDYTVLLKRQWCTKQYTIKIIDSMAELRWLKICCVQLVWFFQFSCLFSCHYKTMSNKHLVKQRNFIFPFLKSCS